MNKFFTAIRFVTFVLCFFLLVPGCGSEKELAKTTKVVSKRIKPKKSVVTQSKKRADLKKQAEKTQPSVSKKKVNMNKKKDVGLISHAAQSTKLMAPALVYNPEGKTDPFAPLFQERSEARIEAGIKKRKRKKGTPRTPLEKINLNQLKLTAIILSKSGNRALVEEASGKGYVIQKGTPIGTHWGKVIKILKDKVIVEEEIENIMGDITINKRELKLQKPFGED